MNAPENANPPIRFFAPENLSNPYPLYKQMRDEAPVYFVPELNLHVVTRYDLLREAIKDSETYSSRYDEFMSTVASPQNTSFPEDIRAGLRHIQEQMVSLPPTMLTLDRPDHTQYRSLVSAIFTVTQIKKSVTTVQSVIDETISRFGDKTNLEFMSQFAFPVPLRIISDRLGIPPQERAFFYEAATSAASALKLSPLEPEEHLHRAQLALDLQRLLIRLFDLRRDDPREDMISILANSKLEQENRHLTHGEALSILNQFLVAGHETTTSSFGWGMLLLCKNPGVQDEIRGDEKLIKTFVEEALRIEAPVQGLPRLVARDTELGDYPLKAGELIMLRFGAANRDERQFENPDMIDVHRKNAGTQMAFGSGVHHCIGSPLARQELNLGWFALLEKMHNIRLNDEYPSPQAEPSVLLRNLPALQIRFDPR